MADRIDDLQGHHLVGEELQGPVPVTGWRPAQPQGDQLCFRLAIKLARCRRLPAFLALQGRFKAFRDQAFADVLDRLGAAVECLCNPVVRPSRPIGIHLEQDLSTAELLR